jgi:transposase
LEGYSLGGISLALKRLGISRQRGRLAVHSPDPAYKQKLTLIEAAVSSALEGGDLTVLYGDEFSFYRQPTVAPKYAPRGQEPVARMASANNIRCRVAGAINVATGELTYLSHNMMGVVDLRRFLKKLRRVYPTGRLLLIWDNWPVHRQPDLLAAAQRLRIHLLYLPTYAPWTNPAEKLWGWLQKDILTMHRHSDTFEAPLQRCRVFFRRFVHGSRELLQYVGLLNPD